MIISRAAPAAPQSLAGRAGGGRAARPGGTEGPAGGDAACCP